MCNRTCAIKLLLFLIFKTDSIWVAWIHQNVLKDRSIWEIKPHQSHTWLFKHLLKLRGLVINWVRIIPRNSLNCRFWLDPWSLFGILINYFGDLGPRQTGINIKTKLASLWRRGCWRLPPARSHQMEQLLIFISGINLSNEEDASDWLIDGVPQSKFSSQVIYNEIRPQNPIVTWHPIVWFKRGILKYKTLTWMTMLNRCPTRDRLLSWSLQVDPACLLCNNSPESRDHILLPV